MLFEPVADNLRESFRIVAGSRAQGEVRELHGVSIASAGVTFQMFNAAFLSGPVASEAELTQRILLGTVHFNARGLEWAFWVCEDWIEARARKRSQQLFDRYGLHRSNLAAMRSILWALTPPAEACLVDGFRLGPAAPPHRAVVDGDEKSAAIAAASIVAKVTRDRLMRRMDAVFPHYGFSSHVGYITPGHSAIVRRRGPCSIHRRSFQALCYLSEEEIAAIKNGANGGRESAAPLVAES